MDELYRQRGYRSYTLSIFKEGSPTNRPFYPCKKLSIYKLRDSALKLFSSYILDRH